jgi:ketosteroid isomerase-like protein
MSHPHEGMLKTLYDAFTKGNMETVMALFTDDIEFHVFGRSRVAGSYRAKDQILHFFAKLANTYGDTFRLQIRDILANDRHGVVLTFERAHRDGKVLENRAVHVYDIRDGKCAQCRAYNEHTWDELWT